MGHCGQMDSDPNLTRSERGDAGKELIRHLRANKHSALKQNQRPRVDGRTASGIVQWKVADGQNTQGVPDFRHKRGVGAGTKPQSVSWGVPFSPRSLNVLY